MPGYGDSWAAANEGADLNQNMINNWYHNQAQQALNATYGPMAGNPQAALAMQNFNYLGQLDPLLVQHQGLTNAGLGTENALNQGLLQPRIQAGQAAANTATAGANVATATVPADISIKNSTATKEGAGADVATQSVPYAVQTNAGNANLATGQGAGAIVAADQAKSAQHIRGFTAFGDAAEAALRAGADAPTAFKAGVQAAQAAGADPTDIQQGAAALQQHFMSAPYQVIDAVRSQTLAASNSQYAALTPQQRAELAKAGFDIQGIHQKNIESAQKTYSDAKADEDAILGAQGPIGQAAQSVRDTQSALGNMRKMLADGEIDSNSLARIAKGDYSPGSPEKKFKSYADQVGSALSLSQMQTMREANKNASTGIRNTAEFEAAGKAWGNFDLNLSPQQLQQQVENAQGHLNAASIGLGTEINKNNSRYLPVQQRRERLESLLNSTIAATPGTGDAPMPSQAGAGPAAPPANVGAPSAATPPPGGAPAPTPPTDRPNSGASGAPDNAPLERTSYTPAQPGDPAAYRADPIPAQRSYLQQAAVGSAAARANDIPDLHPVFASRLASAIQEARAAGIPASVFSGARGPSATGGQGSAGRFDMAGYSLHPVGMATDIEGIGRPGSATAHKWYEIATRNGLYNPYGPDNQHEWNHYQAIPQKALDRSGPIEAFYQDRNRGQDRRAAMWAAEDAMIPGAGSPAATWSALPAGTTTFTNAAGAQPSVAAPVANWSALPAGATAFTRADGAQPSAGAPSAAQTGADVLARPAAQPAPEQRPDASGPARAQAVAGSPAEGRPPLTAAMAPGGYGVNPQAAAEAAHAILSRPPIPVETGRSLLAKYLRG